MATAFTIGALSKGSGVSIETIRYYERIGLVPKPARSDSGYRHYHPTDLARLKFIKRGRELGFSIEEIRTLLLLAEHPETPCHEADDLAKKHLQLVEERIADLIRLRGVLTGLAGCEQRLAKDCKLIETLSGGETGTG